MFLIDDILLAPVNALIWLGQKINEAADQELYDEGRIKEKLLGLQMRLELGEISEEEHKEQEAELLARLDAARAAGEGEEGGGE